MVLEVHELGFSVQFWASFLAIPQYGGQYSGVHTESQRVWRYQFF